MELGFVITNDEASYVAKEDSICLFNFAREAALNKQQLKPCVPLAFFYQFLHRDCKGWLQIRQLKRKNYASKFVQP